MNITYILSNIKPKDLINFVTCILSHNGVYEINQFTFIIFNLFAIFWNVSNVLNKICICFCNSLLRMLQSSFYLLTYVCFLKWKLYFKSIHAINQPCTISSMKFCCIGSPPLSVLRLGCSL